MPDTLFSQSYLDDGLKETEEYRQINPQRMANFRQELERPYRAFNAGYSGSNEAQVEDVLIRPVLNVLGWSYLPQQPLPGGGGKPRRNIKDKR